jgi:hypothetical protein
MKELSTLFNPTVTSEWCAFIAALCLLRRRTGVWRLFIWQLLLTIIAETFGWSSIYFWKSLNNHWIFNLLLLISAGFWIWIFSRAEPMARSRKLLYGLLIGFLCFGLVNMFFFQGLWEYNGYTDVLSDMLIAGVCCYFFYTILREEQFRNLFGYEYFWLANGLLVSSLGSVVVYIFINDLFAFYNHTHINVYGYINYSLNIILYVSFIIAFICRNRNTRSSQV